MARDSSLKDNVKEDLRRTARLLPYTPRAAKVPTSKKFPLTAIVAELNGDPAAHQNPYPPAASYSQTISEWDMNSQPLTEPATSRAQSVSSEYDDARSEESGIDSPVAVTPSPSDEVGDVEHIGSINHNQYVYYAYTLTV